MSPRRPGRPHSGAWPRIRLAGVTLLAMACSTPGRPVPATAASAVAPEAAPPTRPGAWSACGAQLFQAWRPGQDAIEPGRAPACSR